MFLNSSYFANQELCQEWRNSALCCQKQSKLHYVIAWKIIVSFFIARQHTDTRYAIFNNLERPQTKISRSDHSLTLNISEMAKDTAIVTMENE